MDNGQAYEFIKQELIDINSQIQVMCGRMSKLETEVAYQKGGQEGFSKFKDILYIGYMVIMTGIAVYAMFFKI